MDELTKFLEDCISKLDAIKEMDLLYEVTSEPLKHNLINMIERLVFRCNELHEENHRLNMDIDVLRTLLNDK